MPVFAFDRDNTVSTSNGPVPLDVVILLKERYPVYAIGNPALTREAGIPYAEGGTKEARILWLAQKYPDETIVVVDDIRPRLESLPSDVVWRVEYYTPQEFVNVMEKWLR